MICGWCHAPIGSGKRRDSRYCSQRCRQASHRFGRGVEARARANQPLRLAYADPPYPGLARRYYADHPDYGGEVDHRALLQRLASYDGWALSTSAEALPMVLGICAELELEVRVAAWVRGARASRSARPASSWEPVVYAGGRQLLESCRGSSGDGSRRDALVYAARARRTDPARVIGAKPSAFAFWMFDLIGARGGDTLDDLFPGSGGIGRAWLLLQEASRAAADDASPAAGADASLAGGDDVSGPPGVDASTRALDDASPRALGDGSRAARDDASPEYSQDASLGRQRRVV